MDNQIDRQTLIDQLQQNTLTIDTKLQRSLDALKNYIAQQSKKKQPAPEETAEDAGGETRAEDTNPLDYHALQLVLQYRLNNHDILKSLFLYQQSLWQIVGISPAHSGTHNFERLAYIFGSDDFHYLLSTLNQLLESLLKQVACKQRKEKNKARQLAPLKNTKSSTPVLTNENEPAAINFEQGLRRQTEALALLHATESIVETLRHGEPLIGSMLDAIAALGEPVSRLYQALEYGFELSGSIFQQMSMNYGVSASLTHIIDKLNALGQSLTPHLSLHPAQDTHQAFFLPNYHKDQRMVEDEAMRLRLGNFFYKK